MLTEAAKEQEVPVEMKVNQKLAQVQNGMIKSRKEPAAAEPVAVAAEDILQAL